MQEITEKRINRVTKENFRTAAFQVARALVSDDTIGEDDYLDIFQDWLAESTFDDTDFGLETMFYDMVGSVKVKYGDTPLDDIIAAANPANAPDYLKIKGLRLVNKLASICLLLDGLKSPFPLAQITLAEKLSTSQQAISSGIRILLKSDFLETANNSYHFSIGSKGSGKLYCLKKQKIKNKAL